jgi:hypothetical protein
MAFVTGGSVIVPVAFVGGMAMSVVEVVDVIVVGHGDMSATFPMGVLVSGVLGVAFGGALVEVPLVGSVKVPVVEVIDMVAVRDGYMPAAVTVNVGVVGVLEMGGGHGCSSCECRMASLTI